jgi:hypothetical protein
MDKPAPTQYVAGGLATATARIARHDRETWLRVTQAMAAGAGYACARAGGSHMAALAMEIVPRVLRTLTAEDP